ncbi:MAG: hypothetical protein AB7P50_21185 [Alphaproteobacteria bacterium]
MKDWVGKRAQAGRLPPSGFPRGAKFRFFFVIPGKRAARDPGSSGWLPQALDPGSPLCFGRGDKTGARERDQFFDRLGVKSGRVRL